MKNLKNIFKFGFLSIFIITAFVFSFSKTEANEPNLDWVKQLTGESGGRNYPGWAGLPMVSDSNGNIYVTGYF